MSDSRNKTLCRCLFTVTVSSIFRSPKAERKESLGQTESIELQVWNTFESGVIRLHLMCLSVETADVTVDVSD